MAFRSNGPVMLALPPFRGVTRRIILTALAVFFGGLVVSLIQPDTASLIRNTLFLHPHQVRTGALWQLVTYPLIDVNLVSLLFALFSIWLFGSQIEDERGSLWFTEYMATSTICGGLAACLISYALGSHVSGFEADVVFGGTLWPATLAILLAFARFHAEETIRFNFLIGMKAKYLAAIYLLIYLALALGGHDRFGATLALTNALSGYAFLRLAPRKGLRFAASERWYRLRNSYYRAKRKRAGKKFEVYMREQGKDVRVNENEPRDPRDLNDKRWMN